MVVVVAYDVSTETKQGRRRLRRVAQTCEDYGQRVQKSLFECLVSDADWIQLRHRLLAEISLSEDNLRFYFLDKRAHDCVEHHGLGRPVDLTGPLII